MLSKKNKSNRVLLSLIICIFALQTVSCGTTDSDEIESSYFYVSVNGPSMNGEFRIEEDPSTSNILGLIVPAIDEVPAFALATFNNQEGLTAVVQVPAEERLTELTNDDTNSPFTMGITNTIDEIILGPKNVSIHVTRLKNNSLGITEMKANFEGVMVFLNNDGIEEIYTVKGDFAFTQNIDDIF